MLCLACGGADEASAPTPTAAPEPRTAPEPPAAPDAETERALARGERHYQLYCASCHGKTGAGDGPASVGLDPRPARHDDREAMNALSDAHLHRVIALGGPAVGKSPLMAPWGGTLSDEQIDDVIVYIRSLADPP